MYCIVAGIKFNLVHSMHQFTFDAGSAKSLGSIKILITTSMYLDTGTGEEQPVIHIVDAATRYSERWTSQSSRCYNCVEYVD